MKIRAPFSLSKIRVLFQINFIRKFLVFKCTCFKLIEKCLLAFKHYTDKHYLRLEYRLDFIVGDSVPNRNTI